MQVKTIDAIDSYSGIPPTPGVGTKGADNGGDRQGDFVRCKHAYAQFRWGTAGGTDGRCTRETAGQRYDPAMLNRNWFPTALSAAAFALGAAALVVTLTRPAETPVPAAQPSTSAELSASDGAAATKTLCGTYATAAHAVAVATNGSAGGDEGERAFAGVALTNGAGMLERAVSENPALPAAIRGRAVTLASAYRGLVAVVDGSVTDSPWQAAKSAVLTANTDMRKSCE